MSYYVLIHGGSHGAWCWEKVIPFLKAGKGVEGVAAIDLLDAALEIDPKEIQEITIRDYVDGVVIEIENLDLHNIILIGHSMAGIIIPAVVPRVKDRVKRVIYLSSSNPIVGQSIENLMAHPSSPLSRGVSIEEMFCSDLDEQTSQWLLSNLREDPMKPFSEPVSVCTLPDGIPSTYVLLEKDRALLPDYQLEQARNANVDEVRRFDSGHSAFASKPEELATLFLEYA
jgi:pimeloyl-ACP methyl ester carboxylesterase